MHVGFVSAYPPSRSSLNEYGFHFIRHLVRKDEVTKVTIFAEKMDVAYDPPEKCVVEPVWRFDAPANALALRRAISKAKPDLVIYNIQFATFGGSKIPATLGLLAPALTRRSGIPTIVLLHNIMETVDLQSAGYAGNPVVERILRWFGAIVTRMVLQADLVTLTIPKYVEIIRDKYGAANALLAPHGSFEEPEEPDYDPPRDPTRIMTFGKFGTYKKVEVLIEAFEKLKAGREPLELVIAGSDSPNAPGYLDGVAERYTAVDGVRFTGYVAEEDVPRIFSSSAVVVFPYTSTTGSSGVLHQAGEYGRAAVLPDIGDLAELVTEEGYAGEFFDPDDASSLAEAIARLLDDPARLRAAGRQNFRAASGLPMSEVVDWYLIHAESLSTRG